MASRGRLTVEIDGMTETLRAFQALDRELERPTANRQLRQAAGESAGQLVADLRAAASASGVPVAPRVAASIRVKSDRLPVVSIGGRAKVGAGGAPASALLWGSEHGPAGDVNRFAVESNPAGYWIAPTVERFGRSDALDVYRRAVYQLLREYKLV